MLQIPIHYALCSCGWRGPDSEYDNHKKTPGCRYCNYVEYQLYGHNRELELTAQQLKEENDILKRQIKMLREQK